MAKSEDYYKFDLSFDGNLVEHSADAFDVANTIMAISTTMQQMIRIKYGDEAAKQVSLNINAFKEGSLKTQFLMMLSDPESIKQNAELVAVTGLSVYDAAKSALGMVHDYIQIRIWLKGKSPDKVAANPGGDTYNITLNNSTMTINQSSFKALQDKTVAKSIDKAVEPLMKEGSELENLSLYDEETGDQIVIVNKAEAKYVKKGDTEFQTIDSMRLKGVVTKIDTKVRSGYLNLGNMGARRVAFTYQKKLPLDEFNTLVLSLQTQVQIYVVGAVDSDMEGLPRSIDIQNVEEDEKLL